MDAHDARSLLGELRSLVAKGASHGAISLVLLTAQLSRYWTKDRSFEAIRVYARAALLHEDICFHEYCPTESLPYDLPGRVKYRNRLGGVIKEPSGVTLANWEWAAVVAEAMSAPEHREAFDLILATETFWSHSGRMRMWNTKTMLDIARMEGDNRGTEHDLLELLAHNRAPFREVLTDAFLRLTLSSDYETHNPPFFPRGTHLHARFRPIGGY